MNRDVRDQLQALRSELPTDDDRQTVTAPVLSGEPGRSIEGGAEKPRPLVSRPRVDISGVETWQYRPRRRSRARSAVLAAAGIAAAVLLGNVVVGAVAPSRGRVRAVVTGAAVGTDPAAALAAPADYLKRGLPDPALTPGERISGPAPVLAPAAPLRDEAKEGALTAYGLAPGDRHYVVCRLIPASLNGTSSPRNLFPTTPWFADLKARLDKALTEQVAQRRMTTEQAERELTGNWVQAMHDHHIRNYGTADASKAQQIEDTLRW